MSTLTMPTRPLGPVSVSAIGLGAMPMSSDRKPVSTEQALATIHAALDAGVTLIDTADAYTANPDDVGHNERLVAQALAAYGGNTDDVIVATKGGHTRTADGGWDVNGSPDYIRRACDASLKALGVEAIGLYQYHRPDPAVPYEETLGVFRELHEAGKVRLLGISNADVQQIALAREVLGDALVSVQNQLSPKFRSSEDELAYCTEHGIAFLPWSPLGGMGEAANLGSAYAPFAEVGAEVDASPQQVCLAWLLAKSPIAVPIPGSSRPETIRDSVEAASLQLTPEQVSRLEPTG